MDEFTLGVALLGAILGILNTWHDINQARVRLSVFPSMAYATHDRRWRLCIGVVNRSAFPVTIAQVGFTMEGTREQMATIQPDIIDGGKFPRRLEAHDAFTVYLDPTVHEGADFQRTSRAYARTTTGHEVYSGKKAVRHLKKQRLINRE